MSEDYTRAKFFLLFFFLFIISFFFFLFYFTTLVTAISSFVTQCTIAHFLQLNSTYLSLSLFLPWLFFINSCIFVNLLSFRYYTDKNATTSFQINYGAIQHSVNTQHIPLRAFVKFYVSKFNLKKKDKKNSLTRPSSQN